MPHDHHHHHIDPDSGDVKISAAIAINLGLTVAQIIGGILSGSLALIADAIHNLSDAVSLILAFWARRIARRPANDQMTFGYGRAETIAALVNYTTLILIGVWLAVEAIQRLFAPQPVQGWTIVVLAGIAILIDLATALLTYRLSKQSVNIRAAFLHNLADALGSVAVIIAGIAVLWRGWWWVDPLVTMVIAGYILWLSLREIGGVIHTLMLGTPQGISPSEIADNVAKIDGIAEIYDVRAWIIDERTNAFSARIRVAPSSVGYAEGLRRSLRQRLHDDYGFENITLEIETTPGDRPQTPHHHSH